MIDLTPQEINAVVRTFDDILDHDPDIKREDLSNEWEEVCVKTAQALSTKSDNNIYASRNTDKKYRLVTDKLKVKTREGWIDDLVLFEPVSEHQEADFYAMGRREFYTNFWPL